MYEIFGDNLATIFFINIIQNEGHFVYWANTKKGLTAYTSAPIELVTAAVELSVELTVWAYRTAA